MELSISELADLLGIPRSKIKRRVASGVIPSVKMGTGRNAKRVVLLSTLRSQFRELYEAVMFKVQVASPYGDDD